MVFSRDHWIVSEEDFLVQCAKTLSYDTLAQGLCENTANEWQAVLQAVLTEQPKHRPGGILYEQDPWPLRAYTIWSVHARWTRIMEHDYTVAQIAENEGADNKRRIDNNRAAYIEDLANREVLLTRREADQTIFEETRDPYAAGEISHGEEFARSLAEIARLDENRIRALAELTRIEADLTRREADLARREANNRNRYLEELARHDAELTRRGVDRKRFVFRYLRRVIDP